MFPDIFRLITLTLLVICIATFPAAVYVQGREKSAYWAVAGCECFMFVSTFAITEHLGEPLVWYRTPLTMLGSVFVLLFSIQVIINSRRANR